MTSQTLPYWAALIALIAAIGGGAVVGARIHHARLVEKTKSLLAVNGSPVDSPAEVSEGTYLPVAFDKKGNPVQPATTGESGELTFAPDGSALVRPGDSALLKWILWPAKIPTRVVYVIDEPDRKGFAYGTLPGHPERGEESFVVERRADESVWLTIRAFSRPSSGFFWATYPILRMMQAIFTERYKRALTGPIDQ